METCLLLAARRYQFTDDKTNKPIEGVSLTYLTGENQLTGEQRGMFPLSITAPVELFDALTELPAVYDVDFKQRPGKGGKPTLQVVGVRFKRSFSFQPASEAVQ